MRQTSRQNRTGGPTYRQAGILLTVAAAAMFVAGGIVVLRYGATVSPSGLLIDVLSWCF